MGWEWELLVVQYHLMLFRLFFHLGMRYVICHSNYHRRKKKKKKTKRLLTLVGSNKMSHDLDNQLVSNITFGYSQVENSDASRLSTLIPIEFVLISECFLFQMTLYTNKEEPKNIFIPSF